MNEIKKLACEWCGKESDPESMALDNNSCAICTKCVSEAMHCDDCGNLFMEGDDGISNWTIIGTGRPRKWLCSVCREDYLTCEQCGVLSANADGDGIDGDNLCFDCANTRNNNDMQRGVDFKKSIVVYDGDRKAGDIIKSPRKFGIEFEIVPVSIDNVEYKNTLKKTPGVLADCWGIGKDGSLSEGGIEIQTAPMRLNKGEKTVLTFCNKVTKAGWKVDNSCGTHVHLDGKDFLGVGKELRQLMLLYFSMDDVIRAMIPKERRKNRFCSPLPKEKAISKNGCTQTKGFSLSDILVCKTSKEVQEVYYKLKGDNMQREKGNHYCEGKYYGINFHALFYKYGTLEIRYHEGTIEGEPILYWTAFHQHIMDKAHKMRDEDCLEIYFTRNIEKKLLVFADKSGLPEYLLNYALDRITAYEK